MLAWKDLAWWELEKSKPRRERHTHVKFNPLADPERQVVAVAGLGWKERAGDFQSWGALGGQFVERFDVPWATGKQGSLANLTPNSREGVRRHAPANDTAMLIA